MEVYQTKAGGTGSRWRLALLISIALGIALLALAASPRPAAALDSEETTVLQLINDYRAANGLGTLTLNNTLNSAARWMSEDMAANNYFSHTDSLGRDPFVRINSFGYTYNTWKGENLAAGVAGGQEAMDLWKGSPGHNANMLNPNYTVIGVARAFRDGSTFGWYWTTDFGGQADPPPPPEPTAPPPPAPTQAPPPTWAPPPVTPAPVTAPPATPVVTAAPAAAPSPPAEPGSVSRTGNSQGLWDPWWEAAVRVESGLSESWQHGSPALVAFANYAKEYLKVTARSGDRSAGAFWRAYFGGLVLATGR